MELWGRFALLVAVFSVVLGLYWPHVKQRSVSVAMITIIDPLGVLFNREIPYDDDDDDDLYSADESFFQHPKLTGKIFSKKATNQAASSRGFGVSGPNLPVAVPGRPMSVVSNQDRLASVFFIFTAVIVILVLVIIVNKGKRASRAPIHSIPHDGHVRSSEYQEPIATSKRRRNKTSVDRATKTRDLLADKREGDLAVTIRHLIAELERQKLSMLQSLSEGGDLAFEASENSPARPEAPGFGVSEPDLSRATTSEH